MFRNNYLYFIWGIFYFFATWLTLGANSMSFGITLMAYAISLTMAFSDAGEMILRFIERVRALETKREKYYLIPMFDDVYKSAIKKFPKLRRDIDIYIVDTMIINAYALGRNTVAVTKGAIDSLSEEELKGFIAHEIGHIAHGDTIALLLTVIGNGIFTLVVMCAQFALNIINSMVDRRGLVGAALGFMKIFFNIVLFYFYYIGQFILSINSRKNEYAADAFAFDIGYGDDLVSALYILQDMRISDNGKLVDRLCASHPHIAKRIGTLERMIDDEDEI